MRPAQSAVVLLVVLTWSSAGKGPRAEGRVPEGRDACQAMGTDVPIFEPGDASTSTRKRAEDALQEAWAGFEEKLQILWREFTPTALPQSGELYLLSGYISYTVWRIVWDGPPFGAPC